MHLRITAVATFLTFFNLVGCGVDSDVTTTRAINSRTDAGFVGPGFAAISVTSGTQTLANAVEGNAEGFSITHVCVSDNTNTVDITWTMPGADCDATSGSVPTTALVNTDPSCAAWAVDWTHPSVDPNGLRDVSCTWSQDTNATPVAGAQVAATHALGTLAVPFTITVGNEAPTVGLTNDGNVDEGATATFDGTASDPGTEANELTWAIWYFGDGFAPTEAANTVIVDCGATPGYNLCNQADQSETHVYVENLAYTAWLRVCDDDLPAGQAPSDFPGDFAGYMAAHAFGTNTPVGCDDDSNTITIGNATPIPTAPSIINLTTSLDDPNVNEGELFGVIGTYTDEGVDTHDIEWTFGTQGVHDNDPADDAETSTARPNFTLIDTNPPSRDPGGVGSDFMDFQYYLCYDTVAGSAQETIWLSVQDDDGATGLDGRQATILDAVPTVIWTAAVPPVVSEHGGSSAWTTAPNMGLPAPAGAVDEGNEITFATIATTTAQFGCDDVQPSTYRWDCDGGLEKDVGTGAVGAAECDGDDTCTCVFQTGDSVSTVNVLVRDSDNSPATADFVVTVNNVRPFGFDFSSTLPNVVVDEGSDVSFSGVLFDDPGLDGFSAQWDFGDPAGTDSNPFGILAPGGRVLTYALEAASSFRYQVIGDGVTQTFTATLSVQDEDGTLPLPSDTFTIDVRDVAPTISDVTMRNAITNADLGTAETVDEKDPTMPIQIDVVGAPGTPGAIDPIERYIVDWGDGSTSEEITSNTSASLFHPQGSYPDSGSFTITVTVRDSDGSEFTYTAETFTVDVTNLAPVIDTATVSVSGLMPAGSGDAITVTEGVTYDFTAQFTDQATTDDLDYDFEWDITGPGTTGTPSGTVTTYPAPPAQASVGTTQFRFDEHGTWNVTLTVTDKDGLDSTPYPFTVNVDDVHPIVTARELTPAAARLEAGTLNIEMTAITGDPEVPVDDDILATGPHAQVNCRFPTVTGTETQAELLTTWNAEPATYVLDVGAGYPDTTCGPYERSGNYWVAVKVDDEDSTTIVIVDGDETVGGLDPIVMLNVAPVPSIEVGSAMSVNENFPLVGTSCTAGTNVGGPCANDSECPGAPPNSCVGHPTIVGGSFTDVADEDYWNAWWTYVDPDTNGALGFRRIDVEEAGNTDLVTEFTGVGAVPFLPEMLPERFLDDQSDGTATFCGVLWLKDADMGESEAVPFPPIPGVANYGEFLAADHPAPTGTTCPFDSFTFNVVNLDPIFTSVNPIPPQIGEGASITAQVLNGTDVGAVDVPADQGDLVYRYYWDWQGSAATSPAPFVSDSPLASNIYTVAGTYILHVEVEDDDGGLDFEEVSIQVINIPPEIVEILQTGPKLETEEVSVAPLLRSYDVGDLTFGYDWNDPNDGFPDLDTGSACITGPNCDLVNPGLLPGDFEIAGPVGTHFFSQDGVYTVTVEICDDFPTCVRQDVDITITNLPPVVTIRPPLPVNEGSTGATLVVDAFDISVLDEAEFVADPTGTFSVDWGDGNGLVASDYLATSDPSVGRFEFAFGGSFADDGVLTMRVAVDDGTDTTIASTAFTVLNVNPAIGAISPAAPTLNEGGTVSLTIPVNDPGSDTFTYAVDWNDDGTFDSTSTTGTVMYTYPDNNTGGAVFDAVVRVTDDDGGSDTTTHAIMVNNVTPTITVNGPSGSIIRGSSVAIGIVATEPGADTLTYEWDWSYDGATFNAEATTTTAAKTASRSHVYATTGTFVVRCRATDDDGAVSGEVSRTIVVTAPEANLLVDATSPIVEGASTVLTIETASAGTFDFQVTWADGSAAEDFNNVVIATAGDTFATPAHAYADDGDYSVAVRSTRQSDGKEAFAAIQVLVNNLVPTITVPAAAPTAVQLTEGTSPAPFTITATDVAADTADPGLNLEIRGSIAAPTCASCEVGCGGCDHIVVARTSFTSWTLTWDPVDWTDFYNTDFTVVVIDKDGGEATQDWNFALTFTDTDTDGLPDGWETQEFGDNTQVATGDPDGDGLTNLEEFQNGTDPEVSNAPTVPTLLAPVDRPVGELQPTLVVANATDPENDELSYHFQVYDNEDLLDTAGNPNENLVFEDLSVAEGASTTSVDINLDLTDGATYWWRARAADTTLASGPWAEAVWFVVSVDNHAPGTPVIVAPADGATVAVANPYFEVTPVDDVDGDTVTYNFMVYSDSGLTTLVASAMGRALPTWFADPALANGDYWWFAEATDGMMTSQTTVGTFTVELPQANLPPGAPAVAQPSAGATVTTATPDLVVSNATDPDGDALTYFFEVADNLAFVNGAASSPVTEGTSITTWSVPVALDEDTAYFWRARAFDGLEAGDWVMSTFIVDATNDAPGMPSIVAPANGAVLIAEPTQLVAGNASDPEGDTLTYTFEISDDAAGANILATGSDVAEGDGTTAWTITGATFAAGTTYYWRVSANDGTADGAFTAWAAFTLFEAQVDLVPDDGCGCRGTAANGGWAMAFLGVFFALARRRRR